MERQAKGIIIQQESRRDDHLWNLQIFHLKAPSLPAYPVVSVYLLTSIHTARVILLSYNWSLSHVNNIRQRRAAMEAVDFLFTSIKHYCQNQIKN